MVDFERACQQKSFLSQALHPCINIAGQARTGEYAIFKNCAGEEVFLKRTMSESHGSNCVVVTCGHE